MLIHYLKIILRTFLKRKAYTLINTIGLTTGMVVFILIMMYVNYEFSVDQYHEHKDQIYRIAHQRKGNLYMGNDQFAVTMAPLAPIVKEEFPEVKYAVRIGTDRGVIMGTGDKRFQESVIYGVDPDLFRVFTFEYVYGNPETFLKDKHSGVISESVAKKYFGDDNPIGKALIYNNDQEFVVCGVIKDMPPNSHFTMGIMLPFETMVDDENLANWGSNYYYTYLLLKKGSNPDVLESKFPALMEKYDTNQHHMKMAKKRLYLQDFSEIHLYTSTNADIGQSTNVNSLYIYSTIAFMILLIACINYMNLATAQAASRAKEVGIRKVAGAYRYNLIARFLGESTMLTIFSLLLSLLIVALILPFFEQFVELDLSLNLMKHPNLIFIILALSGFVAIASGSYPAFALSAIKPIAVLKGSFLKSAQGITLRNILVVTQFAISGCLIICAVIVLQQLNFIQNKDMGYNKEHTITLHINDWDMLKKTPVFKEELMKIPGVLNVAISSDLPNNIRNLNFIDWPGKPEEINWDIYGVKAGFDFIELYDIELVAGRSFSREAGDEKGSVLINESAAKSLPWDDPIGKDLIRWRDTCRIVGIVKDFHQHSLHQKIMPLQLFFGENEREVSIKISGDHIDQILAGIEQTKSVFSEKYPFSYSFFEDEFDKAYKSEKKTAKLANWFTLITIIIACLGLYGLAAFTAEQRIKEVGIRKILGARVHYLIFMLSKDFTILVLISFILSAPLAYFVMQQWLSDFAYHISIEVFTFAGALILMILISWLTVAYRTFKVANCNPVNALKEE